MITVYPADGVVVSQLIRYGIDILQYGSFIHIQGSRTIINTNISMLIRAFIKFYGRHHYSFDENDVSVSKFILYIFEVSYFHVLVILNFDSHVAV